MTINRYSYLTFALYIAVLGCAKDAPTARQASSPDASPTVKSIGIAYALGGKGDLSYNDAASAGVAKLHQRYAAIKEFEPSSLDDYGKGLDLLALRDPDVIFCVGYLYDEPAKRIAVKHRNTLFVVLDGSVAAEPNVASVKFNARQGSFLAGAVAGRLTKTRIVAFVGGADLPIINEFYDGYAAGAQFAHSGATIIQGYIGTGAASFSDPVKGREIALSVISRGADVIFHAAGQSGNGVLKAAQERRIWAIGVDVDQAYLAKGTVATSMKKNFDAAMVYVISLIQTGTHLGGKNHLIGLNEGAVSLSPVDPAVRPLIGDIVERARQEALRRFP